MEFIKKHLIWFVVGFVILCIVAFAFGYKNGKKPAAPIILPKE